MSPLQEQIGSLTQAEHPPFEGTIHLLKGAEVLANKDILDKVANTYIVVFGGDEAEEGAYCSVEGRGQKISLPEYQKLLIGNGVLPHNHFSNMPPSLASLETHKLLSEPGDSQVCKCKNDACTGQYLSYYKKEDLMQMFVSQLAASDTSIPLLSYWDGGDDLKPEMVCAFTMGMVCQNTKEIHRILSASPYFAMTHDDPNAEIDKFLGGILNLKFPFFYTHEAAALPEYRGRLWNLTALQVGAESSALGASQVIMCSFESSPYYKFIRRIKQDTHVYKTLAHGDNSELLVFSDDLQRIYDSLERAAKMFERSSK
jgi:hypothetical protein